jgi:DNA-binding transcriptional regulator YiaG
MMSKFEDAVRAEVLRLVRKELRAQVAPLQKEVRELRRAFSQTRKQLVQIEKLTPKQAEPATVLALGASEEEISKSRISGNLIRSLRRRLGITQGQLATLVGVSLSAVTLWETNKRRPTGQNRAAIVALRKLGRREAARMLEARLSGEASGGAPKEG